MQVENDADLVVSLWLARHQGTLAPVWGVGQGDGRRMLLIDLVKAQVVVHDDERWYEVVGTLLTEILEAGASLASYFVPGDLPKFLDASGDLGRVVAFQGGDEETRLLTAWWTLRDRAQRRMAAV